MSSFAQRHVEMRDVLLFTAVIELSLFIAESKDLSVNYDRSYFYFYLKIT